MQNKIITAHDLLDSNGALIESGWSDRELLSYNPRSIRLNRMSMKEWDGYIIFGSDGKYALSLTFADKRFTGLIGAAFYNIERKTFYECYNQKLLPAGSITLSKSIENGSVVYNSGSTQLMYLVTENERHLFCKFSPSYGDNIEANIHLSYNRGDDIFSVATPFKDDEAQFCFNQKLMSMPAQGYVKVNGETFEFSPQSDFGILDWGRGVWLEDITRYRCTGAFTVDGKRAGFSIGYGFGVTEKASENFFFIDGHCQKLGRVFIDIPEDGSDVVIRSDDKRFEVTVVPNYSCESKHSLLKFSFSERMLFGRMSGTVVLDDGTQLNLDSVPCLCERTNNKY